MDDREQNAAQQKEDAMHAPGQTQERIATHHRRRHHWHDQAIQVPWHPSRQQTRHGRALGTREQRLQLDALSAQDTPTTRLQPASPRQRLQESNQQSSSRQLHNAMLGLRKRQTRHACHREARTQDHERQGERPPYT